MESGISEVAELLNEILTPEQTTTVLIETMAGKGTEIGKNFEEIRKILDRVEQKEKVGVCLIPATFGMQGMTFATTLTVC